MSSHILIRSRALAIGCTAVYALFSRSVPTAAAQDRTAAAIGAEQVLFSDCVALSATLEIALLGVPGVTDVQREGIEVLEDSLRRQIARIAGPLRHARRAARLGRAEETALYDREINQILASRLAAIDAARAQLTPAQRRRFDQNLLAIGGLENATWIAYIRPYVATSVIGTTAP